MVTGRGSGGSLLGRFGCDAKAKFNSDLMFRHPSAAVNWFPNCECHREKVLTVSCRPDYFLEIAHRCFRRWAFSFDFMEVPADCVRFNWVACRLGVFSAIAITAFTHASFQSSNDRPARQRKRWLRASQRLRARVGRSREATAGIEARPPAEPLRRMSTISLPARFWRR